MVSQHSNTHTHESCSVIASDKATATVTTAITANVTTAAAAAARRQLIDVACERL